MSEIEKFLVNKIKKIDNKYTVTLCGSYRRGLESSGDIDVLLTHPNYVSLRFAEDHNLRSTKNLIIETKRSPEILLKKIIDTLKQLNFITDTIASGDTQFMGVCKVTNDHLHRRIDIRILPYDEYYCGVMHMTGSNMFNQNLRSIAKEKGFILNEYCLRKLDSSGRPGKVLKIHSEQDIFDYLEIEYKRPEERY